MIITLLENPPAELHTLDGDVELVLRHGDNYVNISLRKIANQQSPYDGKVVIAWMDRLKRSNVKILP